MSADRRRARLGKRAALAPARTAMGLARCLALAGVLVVAGGPRAVRAETLRPLVTEDTETVPAGHVELQVAFEALTDFRSPSSDLHGRLIRGPLVGLNAGLGERAEVQLRCPLRQWFAPDGEASRSVSGDATIGTKVRLLGSRSLGPSLATRMVVKLPNVSETSGIGTDETDVTLELLGGLHLGTATFAGSAGYAILGDPAIPASQNDKVVLGAGFFLPLGPLDVGADLHGLWFGDRQSLDEWSAIGALARQVGRVRLDAGAGIVSRSGENSFVLSAGLTSVFPFPGP